MRTKKTFIWLYYHDSQRGFCKQALKVLIPTITFATISSKLTAIRCFFASGTKLPNNQLICFPAWFVKLVVMTRGEICCRSSITFLSEIRFTKKARRTFYYRLRHTKIVIFFSSCAALTINYFLI